MSLNKNELEYMRLYAQKCDHRNMAPVASFDLAAQLRANQGRGGRMFEKQKQRTDKYTVDDNPNQTPRSRQDFFPGPTTFATHPVPWKGSSGSSKARPFGRPSNMQLDVVNQNAGDTPRDQEDTEDNLSDAERLQKLYRILRYAPPEGLSQIQPLKAPKAVLKSTPRIPAVRGRDFNRNAKGWCTVDGGTGQTATPAPRPDHLPGLLAVNVDNVYYYYYDDPAALSPEAQHSVLQGGQKPRPKSWHPVSMEDTGLQDTGDYNPRPKAWQPEDEVDGSPQAFGDYNPRPAPWKSSEYEDVDLSPSPDVHFGDFNPRPKAWTSQNRKSKSQTRLGDYNPRPKAWQSSKRGHYHMQAKDDAQREMKFGDYNPRPKAWKSPEKHGVRGKVRYGDYNQRPKAWRSAPEDDSSSTTSSCSSEEYSDDEYSYDSTLYSSWSVPACDV
ncbi:uncharacterized protein LOC143288727 [Babylonia areolata]|uniref:uncharacterized protein LOC143288727 n=1 Tax=Babylonia areolata TaxID=304850 RepID=UPI003FD1AFC8